MSTTDTDQIQRQVLLDAPLAKVWHAISDAKEFGAWFGMTFSGPFHPATKVTATITTPGPYSGMVFDFFIEEIIPQTKLSLRWHPYAVDTGVDYSREPTTLVVFDLEPTAKGVILTVTESGFDQIPIERRAKAFTSNEQGWTIQIQNVQTYLSAPT